MACNRITKLLPGFAMTDRERIHGASDGRPGWYVERLGDYLLSQSEQPLTAAEKNVLHELMQETKALGSYHKILNRQVRRTATTVASPQLVLGEAAPERFAIRENGVKIELSFGEGYSVGLFLDQRDNRRRFLTGHIAAGFSLCLFLHADDVSFTRALAAFANTFSNLGYLGMHFILLRCRWQKRI